MNYLDEPLKPSRYAVIRWFGFDKFIPEAAVTSHWVSSEVFLGIRTTITLYSTIVLWANIGTNAQYGEFNHFFAFFTNLTFIGLHAYLVVSLNIYIYIYISLYVTGNKK